ncbi:MAG: hypothetical protein KY475_22885 [Planctomycetes bacterium]|nr:hypothetical protein [Planctomycetota bacterium]
MKPLTKSLGSLKMYALRRNGLLEVMELQRRWRHDTSWRGNLLAAIYLVSRGHLNQRFLIRSSISVLIGLGPHGLVADESGASKAKAPQLLMTWGRKGVDDGEFNVPIGIAINADDRIFITDFRNRRVQEFSSCGKFLNSFSVPGNPSGIAIDSRGRIYVAQFGEDCISVHHASGKHLRRWGQKGTDDGEFHQPAGLAIGPDGSVFLADDVNRRIQKFDANGRFLAKWGEPGTGPGQFGGPEASKLPPGFRTSGPNFLVVDDSGNLHVTEGRGGRVQKFTVSGRFLGAWGSNQTGVGNFGGHSTLPGPTGIAIDPKGRLWVAATNNRVQLFSADGKYIIGFGSEGSEPSQFRTPHGLAVDKVGHLYVVDTRNHRIQKFAP